MRTKYVQMHEQVPRGTCLLEDGQWPDQPKNGRQTDHFKNDTAAKKGTILAENIFFKVPHHVPICAHFYRLNQPAARCM